MHFSSLLTTGFLHKYPLIKLAEQFEKLPALFLVKWRNEFFPQFHLEATDLLELGSRPLGECKQRSAPVSRVRQADQQPLPLESVDQGGNRTSGNPQVRGQVSHAQVSRLFNSQQQAQAWARESYHSRLTA